MDGRVPVEMQFFLFVFRLRLDVAAAQGVPVDPGNLTAL